MSQNSFALASSPSCSFSRAGNETMPELFCGADVNGRRNHVVARLPHVDVVVRMNGIFRADRFAGQLAGAVRDYFVGIRVRARARTGLENVEREMIVEFPFHHLFGRLDNERGPVGIEQTEIGVRLGRGPFDQTEGADEGPRKSITADRKIQNGALGGSAVKGGLGDGHFAHRVFLDSGRSGGHAER